MPDAVDDWMRGANRYALLTPAQELLLATRVRAWLDSPSPTPQQARSGRRAKEQMINCNLRLVAKRVFSFRRMISARGGDLNDALQEGTIGLNRGVEKFDPTRGYKGSTYFCQWIDQSIRRYVMVGVDMIRKPAGAQDIARRWRYRGEQSVVEFCETWGLTQEKLQSELMHYNRATCTSLDQKAHQGENSSELGDLIADPNSEYDLEQLDREEAIRALQEASPADLHLVEVAQSATVKELAAVVGCEPRQVARHLSSARERLRGHLEQPVAVLPRQNVVTLNDHRPVTTSSNGLQSLERLIEAPAAEAPVVQPAAPAKKRTRRTRAEMQAAKAERAANAPSTIKLTIGGVEVEASATDCVALLRGLQAA